MTKILQTVKKTGLALLITVALCAMREGSLRLRNKLVDHSTINHAVLRTRFHTFGSHISPQH